MISHRGYTPVPGFYPDDRPFTATPTAPLNPEYGIGNTPIKLHSSNIMSEQPYGYGTRNTPTSQEGSRRLRRSKPVGGRRSKVKRQSQSRENLLDHEEEPSRQIYGSRYMDSVVLTPEPNRRRSGSHGSLDNALNDGHYRMRGYGSGGSMNDTLDDNEMPRMGRYNSRESLLGDEHTSVRRGSLDNVLGPDESSRYSHASTVAKRIKRTRHSLMEERRASLTSLEGDLDNDEFMSQTEDELSKGLYPSDSTDTEPEISHQRYDIMSKRDRPLELLWRGGGGSC